MMQYTKIDETYEEHPDDGWGCRSAEIETISGCLTKLEIKINGCTST